MTSIAKCRQEFDLLRNSVQRQDAQHIKFTDQGMVINGYDKDKLYVPSATGDLFHRDDSFVRLIVGPYGSGKTTICINEIVRRACRMPAWSNGRRKSRWAVVRNTSGELYSTTLQSWLAWFGELGDIRKRQKPLLTYEHTFNDGFGIIELELIFIALDRPDDVRKVKSLELTGVYLNEMSELPQVVLSHMKGRINGRYPSKAFCPDPYWTGIIADTNPPSEDHYIYRDFEMENLPNYKVFHQPPGLLLDAEGKYYQNINCDNAKNLSADYYTKLAEGQKEGFIKVFCLGQYGIVEAGKRVYPEFNSDIHSVDIIPAIQGDPIHLGWDGGLTPACVVVQLSPRGQFRILKEYIGEDIGIRSFGEYVLQRLQIDFPYNKIGISVFDPAGGKRDDIFEETSCINDLCSIGIKTQAARTNKIEPRLGAVRYFLNIMRDGQPGFLISRKDAPITFKGFARDYIYKRLAISGEERYREEPDKNMASHPMDATQYIGLEFAGNEIAKEKAPEKPINMFNPTLRIF